MSSRDEKQRRRVLAQAADKAREPHFDTTPGGHAWSEVLAELNELVMRIVSANSEKIRKFPGLFPEAAILAQAGSMILLPAESSDVASAEARLGVTLPPSYVEFLSCSNGLLLPAYCKLSSTHELGPYLNADPDGAELLDDHFGDIDEPSDAEYFNYRQSDDFCFRASYAKTAVALNGPVAGSHVASKEFGWILLVTEVAFPDGELEVWEHGSWHNRRYKSFSDYFEEARRSIVGSLSLFRA